MTPRGRTPRGEGRLSSRKTKSLNEACDRLGMTHNDMVMLLRDEEAANPPQLGEVRVRRIVPGNRDIGVSVRRNLRQQMLAQATSTRQDVDSNAEFVILGRGPAGWAAATAAAVEGRSVIVIEPEESIIGLPTGAHGKCFREAAIELEQAGELPTIERVTGIVRRISNQAIDSFNVVSKRHPGIKTIVGKAGFVSSNTINFTPTQGSNAKPQKIGFQFAIIATGSVSNAPPPELNFSQFPGLAFNAESIRTVDRIPKQMVVQGSGVIAVEYAQIFAKLGASVTILVRGNGILKDLDAELQKAAMSALRVAGVKVLENTSPTALAKGATNGNLVVSCRGPSSTQRDLRMPGDKPLQDFPIECDLFLTAIGRHACVDGLGLEKLGVGLTSRQFIKVDENYRTDVESVYAVGDVVGANLATKSHAQADAAIQHILFAITRKDGSELNSPHAIWLYPEVGYVGYTEMNAIAKFPANVGTATIRYSETVRGCVDGEDGFLKLVFEKEHGFVLGVHIFGAQASELAAFGSEIIGSSKTVHDVLRIVFPAITYHELYHCAANKASMIIQGMNFSIRAASRWRHLAHIYLPGIAAKRALGMEKGDIAKLQQNGDGDGVLVDCHA